MTDFDQWLRPSYEGEWERILHVWLAGDTEEKYKRLWFPCSGSEPQKTVDLWVRGQFGGLLLLLEDAMDNETFEECPLVMEWSRTMRGKLGLLLLLDQVSRHCHREEEEREKRDRNDGFALGVMEEILADGAFVGSLSTAAFVFLLMPLRHSPNGERLKRVIFLTEEREREHEHDVELLKKFKRATARRLQHIDTGGQGEREGEGEGERQFSDADILERQEFDADESNVMKEKLLKTVDAYLREKEVRGGCVGVSLSGGVDSMVLTRILTILREAGGEFSIVAVHIDYGNRPESAAEADFVRRWCEKWAVTFRMRRIEEVKRATTKRDEYEKVAREIRYGTYLDVMKEFPACRAFLFGHHQGDLQENVISNMMKGCSLLELSGMTSESHVNGVNIWRPMLPYTKQVVFDFGHRYGVPYFLDTTPRWSTRGKMRNELMPLLEDMYGIGFLEQLSKLAADADNVREMVHSAKLQPFWDSVVETPMCVWFDCGPYLAEPVLFWKEALRHVCHKMLATVMFRDKSIKDNLLRRFERLHDWDSGGRRFKKRPVDGFVALRKVNHCYMQDTRLILFRDGALAGPRTYSFPEKEPLVVKEEDELLVGPWHIRTELLPAGDALGLAAGFLPRHLKQSIEEQRIGLYEALEGRLEYFLPHTGSLCINPRTKALPTRGICHQLKASFPMPSCTADDAPFDAARVVHVVMNFATPAKADQ